MDSLATTPPTPMLAILKELFDLLTKVFCEALNPPTFGFLVILHEFLCIHLNAAPLQLALEFLFTHPVTEAACLIQHVKRMDEIARSPGQRHNQRPGKAKMV